LLSVPQEAIAILDAVRQAVPDAVPCTVKMRRGSDDSPEAEADFFRIFEKAIELGYAGAVVHGRSVEQKYVGRSRWSFLRDLVSRYADTPGFTIGGSGDIWAPSDIFGMISQTGVSLVSVARGCIGNPWLFTQARALMAQDHEAATRPPTIQQQRQVLLEHFELSQALHGSRRAGMMMRKFGIKFSCHHPDPQPVKKAFISVASLDDWRGVLDAFYTGDGPGQAADLEWVHTGDRRHAAAGQSRVA